MSPENIPVLTEIATEILANELSRRARAKNMPVEQLLAEAQSNWDKAERDAEDLQKLGHEGEEN